MKEACDAWSVGLLALVQVALPEDSVPKLLSRQLVLIFTVHGETCTYMIVGVSCIGWKMVSLNY